MSYKEVFRFSVFTFCFWIAYGLASSVFLEFWFPRLRPFVFHANHDRTAFSTATFWMRPCGGGGYPINKSCCKANNLSFPVKGAADSSKWKCLSERNRFEVRRDLGSEGEEGAASLLGWLWWLWLTEEILCFILSSELSQVILSLKMGTEALSLGRFFCMDSDFQFPGWHVTLTCLKTHRLFDVWGPWWSWFTHWQITVMTSVAVPSRLPSWLPAPWTRPSACTP